MADLFPRHLSTKTGKPLLIREAEKQDAPALLNYVQTVAGETDFLTFGPGEFNLSVEDEETFIENSRQAPNQVALIAEMDGEIAGLLHVEGSPKKRLRHNGEFGITVRKTYWGKGIGAHLMEAMIDWAKDSGVIRKLNLKVLVNNTNAIRLYERFGFEKEGCTRRDTRIDGQFYETYSMGLLID